MPNYNDAQGVADLLSQFDFNIISEGPGDFSTQHRKYTCEFSKPGIESFTTTYQSNPDVHGQPTATDVFAALASDALAVDGRHIDDFADEMGFEKPSQAIRAYESCRKTLDWLKNDMQLMTSEISDIAETLDNELDEVKEEVERVQAERKAKHEFEHPPVPEGFTSIEDLQASLNLGEYGDRITDYTGNIGDAFSEIADGAVDLYTHDLLKWLSDNYEWLEEADFQGLLEGCKGDLIKMTQMAQYECFTQDMYRVIRRTSPSTPLSKASQPKACTRWQMRFTTMCSTASPSTSMTTTWTSRTSPPRRRPRFRIPWIRHSTMPSVQTMRFLKMVS